MHWDPIVSKVNPYIVKIQTPSGHGTGFICFYNSNKSLCGIATADHVVCGADKKHEPFFLTHPESSQHVVLPSSQRVCLPAEGTDATMIFISTSLIECFNLQKDGIPLLPSDRYLSPGTEVGWLGFPGLPISSSPMGFFSGHISTHLDRAGEYLIDGVAIHGVSGGPVLYSDGGESVFVIGTISAYWADEFEGETSPGLSIAQDIRFFHNIIQTFTNLEEAIKTAPKIKPIVGPWVLATKRDY